MAALKAELKRAFFQSIYDAVVKGTASQDLVSGDDTLVVRTLEDGLIAFQKMGFQALKSGQLMMGTTGFAHGVTWAPPQQWRSFGQDEVFGMAQEFREVYTDAKLALINAGYTSPTDLQ